MAPTEYKSTIMFKYCSHNNAACKLVKVICNISCTVAAKPFNAERIIKTSCSKPFKN
jgi:hypothetical protein